MWLALATITLAAAIGFSVLAWQFSSSGIGLCGRPCNSREAPHVDDRRRKRVSWMDYHC
jgi:hypothetical protein